MSATPDCEIKEEMQDCVELRGSQYEVKKEQLELYDLNSNYLEDQIDAALRSGRLGLAVDADFLHDPANKRMKLEVEEDNESVANTTIDRSKTESDKNDTHKTPDHENNTRVREDDQTSHDARTNLIKIQSCDKCTFIASKPETFEVHLIVHRTTKPFQCTKCDYKTDYAQRFNNHIMRHFNDKPFECPTCLKSFSTQTHLQTHLQCPHSVKCDSCDYSAIYKTILEKHRKICHVNIDHAAPRVIKSCVECTFIATKSETLELHLNIVHRTTRPFQCNKCDYRTCNTHAFNCHIKTHFNDKPFECPTCLKSFVQFRTLQSHKKSVHSDSIIESPSNDKLMKCDKCDFSSFFFKKLYKHKREKHSEEATLSTVQFISI